MDSKPSCLLRGTTLAVCSLRPSLRAISIHVPLAGHDTTSRTTEASTAISIHMPLAGHDDELTMLYEQIDISIHVPLAGHDEAITWTDTGATQFQSTCPLRGTTMGYNIPDGIVVISIHVPLAGHDLTA